MYYELYYTIGDALVDVKVYEKIDPVWNLSSTVFSAGGWAHRERESYEDNYRRILIINDNHQNNSFGTDRDLIEAKKLYNKKILNNYINLI